MENGRTVPEYARQPLSAARLRDRDWARATAVALVSGLSGALFYAHTAGHIAGQPPWLVAGLVYAVLIGLTAAVIFRFVPRFGPFLYHTTATRIALASVAALVPDVAHRMTTSPFLNATLIVGGAFLLQALLRARRADTLVGALAYAPAPYRTAQAHARP
ncbi:MAG: hypothetical protein KDK53_04210 [Maritimibacter sp.]|nr:hypothetical protein [Maritimibacter sp.]